jgi:lysyl-tRNA synthetase class II
MSSMEEITAAISAKGEEIRLLKASKPPTLKEDLEPLIKELLALKVSYKEVTGEDFDPPKEEKAKKDTGAAAVAEREGPSKTELNKLKKKEQKAARRAEDRAAAGIDDALSPSVSTKASTGEDSELAHLYGDSPMVRSATMTEKVYYQVEDLSTDNIGQKIWLRGRLSTSRAVGKGVFIVLRQMVNTVQGVLFQGSAVPKAMVKYTSAISMESVVDIEATVASPDIPVMGTTVKSIELIISEIHVVSRALELPFSLEDAGRSDADAQTTGLPVVNQDTCLNFRWVDTRTPANQAIFRIQSGVCQLFREYLCAKRFVEIHSPKLIGGASEGGANVFKLKYFEQPACLAQSPQFYKQMASACGGFERVYEIGPVFRAEDSNTNRLVK